MKAATNGPVYAAFYAGLAEICRSHGYALAIHGSLVRDFDVVAIPWTESPSEPSAVIADICQTYAFDSISSDPVVKNHGRICWSIIIGFGTTVMDFSFMPLVRLEQ